MKIICVQPRFIGSVSCSKITIPVNLDNYHVDSYLHRRLTELCRQYRQIEIVDMTGMTLYHHHLPKKHTQQEAYDYFNHFTLRKVTDIVKAARMVVEGYKVELIAVDVADEAKPNRMPECLE